MELKEFKTGAVRIAAEAGVPRGPRDPVGNPADDDQGPPRDFSRGKTITISVGTPLHPTGDDPAAETAELHRVMSSMLDEAIRAYPAAEQPAGLLVAAAAGTAARAPTLAEAAAAGRSREGRAGGADEPARDTGKS